MSGSKRVTRRTAAAFVLAGALALGASLVLDGPPGGGAGRAAWAQGGAANGQQPDADAQGPSGQNIFPTADRATMKLLSNARQLIDEERYAEAVACLGAILESPEDAFGTPDQNSSVQRSLKADAQRLLGQMPARGREQYELQYGATARQMLRRAVSAGDAEGLAEVSRRFFHTRAGYEATLLLGLSHWDHGSPLAGALTLRRLRQECPTADQYEPLVSLTMAACWLRAGMPDDARAALVALKDRNPGAMVSVGGKEVPLFADRGKALEWLASLIGPQEAGPPEEAEQWTMVRGNAARNASTRGSAPLLSLRWQVLTTDHPFVKAVIEQLREEDEEQDRLTVPAFQPLVTGNMVLMRTVKNLVGVDFTTGKLLWEVAVDDPFEELLNPSPDTPFRQPQPLQYALRARLWADATFGRLSSDAERVFAVEDLGLDAGIAFPQQMIFRPQRPKGPGVPEPFNRLAAYDVHSGKLAWHLGGSPEELHLPEAGAFFLGPPLPLLGQLYVLAEMKSEILLLALDAKTGSLLWSQRLAAVDRDILSDPVRRLSGVSPSYADGILVCPTSNRAIVALELATRSLLWGYSLPLDETQARQVRGFFGVRPMMDVEAGGRWADSTVILADGRVLVTPAESNSLVCLDLVDGTLRWQQPRRADGRDDLYLACVHQGKAIVVGRRHVRAVNLADGSPAWEGRVVEFPSQGTPSGLGFLSGNEYFVPLSSGEVLTVDLDAGRAAHTSKSRRGSVPGNLICYKGKVISQQVGGVELYYQLDSLREQVDQRLAGRPEDAEAMALRGEILHEEGKLREAIAALSRSLELQPDPNTRDLLREALFEGLQTDFAAYRGESERIEKLLDEPPQRATFLRLMATGLENAGEFPAALQQYKALMDLDGRQPGELDELDKSLSVRRDRWLRVRLAGLRQKASADVQAEIDRMAESGLKAALDAGTPEALERFLGYFDGQAVAEQARAQLAALYRKAGRLLEAEMLLRREERSADKARAGAAAAELADMLQQAGRLEEAAACYARLRDEFADVPCRGGKTGRQLAESLPANDPLQSWLSPAQWPVGEVLVKKTSPNRNVPPPFNRAVIEYVGSRSPFFTETTVELDQNPPELIGRDGLGRQRWKMSLAEVAREQRFILNHSLARVKVFGHLLMLSLGQKVLAVDTLSSGDLASPKVLWSQNLDEPGPTAAGSRVRIQMVMPGVIQAFPNAPSANLLAGLPGPINEQLVCFRRLRNCVAVEPASGKTLWVRRDVRPDSVLFGDGEYVFVVPPGETTATVLSAADGSVLGKREVPPEPERRAALGRCLLVWRETGSECVLDLVDPWEGRSVFPPRKFHPASRFCVLGHEAAAVMEPTGKFLLLGLPDGRTLIEAALEPEPYLSDIVVLRSPDGYLLVTSSQAQDNAQARRVSPMRGWNSPAIDRGRVYAFDRSGKPLWPKPTKVDDVFLPVDQPCRLPVLVFASMVQERQPSRVTYKTAILALDKRTGRVVCKEEFDNPTATFELSGDPQQKTVEIRLQQQTLVLSFTDKPVAAAAAEGGAAAPSRPLRSVEAVWNAWKKSLGIPEAEPLEDAPDRE